MNTTNPNTVRPESDRLLPVMHALLQDRRDDAARLLRALGTIYSERTEWPYLPISARADTPEQHAAWLLRPEGDCAALHRAYRDYQWTVAA